MAEGRNGIPFTIARVFYVRTLRKGTVRGDHAHRTLQELIVCLRGILEVEVREGRQSRTIRLDNSAVGLYLPPMVWSVQRTREKDTLYLVLASKRYDEQDYIRDYDQFLAIRSARHGS